MAVMNPKRSEQGNGWICGPSCSSQVLDVEGRRCSSFVVRWGSWIRCFWLGGRPDGLADVVAL